MEGRGHYKIVISVENRTLMNHHAIKIFYVPKNEANAGTVRERVHERNVKLKAVNIRGNI